MEKGKPKKGSIKNAVSDVSPAEQSAANKLAKATARTAIAAGQVLGTNKLNTKELAKAVQMQRSTVEMYEKLEKLGKSVAATYTRQVKNTGELKITNSKIAAEMEKQIQSALINNQNLDNTNTLQSDILTKLNLQGDEYNKAEKFLEHRLKLMSKYIFQKNILQSISQANYTLDMAASRLADIQLEKGVAEYKKTVGMKNMSNDMLGILYKKEKLTKQITVAEELVKVAKGKEKKNLQDIVRLAQDQVTELEEAASIQALVDGLINEQTKELEKQKILYEARNALGDKFVGILGDSGNELVEFGKAIKDSMVSPLALIGALVGNALEEFGKIGKASRAFLDNTKLTVDQTEHLRRSSHDIALNLRDQGVTMDKVFAAQGALLSQYGSLNQVTDKAVEKVTLLEKAFGVAAENGAAVIYQLQKSTGLSAEAAGNVAALGANFAKAAGVAPDAVMQDIAQSSEAIAASFKGSAVDLFKTAVEARRLGLSIQKVADISKALLSFESSIEDQMTASVLLGREINLDKARSLALDGKILEAAQETLKQVGSLDNFNKKNVVQREAIAKAAGMTVADLQQSLEKNEAITKMTAAQKEAYKAGERSLSGQNKITAEKLLKDQQNQLVQEKIANAVAKMSEVLANVILPVLEPIFDALAGIANLISGLHINIVRAGVALLVFSKFSFFKNMAAGAWGFVKGLWATTAALGQNTTQIAFNSATQGVHNKITEEAILANRGLQVSNISSGTSMGFFGRALTSITGPLMGFGAALIEVGLGVLLIGGGIGIAAAGIGVMAWGFGQMGDAAVKVINAIGTLITTIKPGPLFSIAAGLGAIAASLALIATFGMAAMPALAMITAMTTVGAIAVGSMSGGSDSSSSSSSSSNEDIVNELREVKKAIVDAIKSQGGGVINIDGRKLNNILGQKIDPSFQAKNR